MSGSGAQPPRNAMRILHVFCPSALLESIEGDLLEQYQEDVQAFGIRRANHRCYIRVLSFMRPGILLRNTWSNPLISRALLRSHLIVALRTMRRQIGYSFINVFGLAIGFAACLLIFAYTKFERSYDDFHPAVEQTYRVNQTAVWNTDGGVMSSTPLPLAERLHTDFPEIEAATRINTPGEFEVRYESPDGSLAVFHEKDLLAADSNFFDFFGVTLAQGDPADALRGHHKVVITPAAARRYFGETNALGKVLHFGADRTPVVVSGVTEPLPRNMHFDFDLLMSIHTNPGISRFEWSWIWTQVVTYVRLKAGTDPAQLEPKFVSIQDEHVKVTFSRIGMDYDSFMQGKGGWNFYLQPVREIHLHSSEPGNRIGVTGNAETVKTFQVLAILILLIAMINFINLATARASRRAKEIGIKKTVGAARSTLVSQFQIESICIAMMAFVLSGLLLTGLRWLLVEHAQIDIPLEVLLTRGFVITAILTSLIIGLVAGAYPAVYLTAFRPVNVLKGDLSAGTGGGRLRNVLVTLQFAVSMILIAGTLLIFHQLRFLNEKNLGFDKENLLVVNNADKLNTQLQSFRDQIAQFPGVMNASIAMDMPGRGSWEDVYGAEGSDIELPIAQLKVDAHYIPTMGMSLVAGRAFEPEREMDRGAAVVNETAARLFGWSAEEALQHRIAYPETGPFEIIGVVNDFHAQSLHQNIMPLVLFHDQSSMWGDQRVVAIRYDNTRLKEVLAFANKHWDDRSGQAPFEYAILDEELSAQYASERQMSKLTMMFSGLAILIAVLGLMGLVAYSAERRRKEIGIRKVLGASLLQVFFLIHLQYLKLLLLAVVLAIPVTFWYMSDWLANFAFHVQISPGVFIWALVVVALIAFVSVSGLTLKASLVDPAKVLRDTA